MKHHHKYTQGLGIFGIINFLSLLVRQLPELQTNALMDAIAFFCAGSIRLSEAAFQPREFRLGAAASSVAAHGRFPPAGLHSGLDAPPGPRRNPW